MIDPSFKIMEDVLNRSNSNRLPDLRMRGQTTLPGGSNAGTSGRDGDFARRIRHLS